MITELDHVNIETTDLDSSIAFYKSILGLKEGWRPPFDVPGAWLYAGDHPILHLVLRPEVNTTTTGPIHHIAVKALDFDAVKARLVKAGLEVEVTTVPDVNVRQIFVTDFNQVRWEFNFYKDA